MKPERFLLVTNAAALAQPEQSRESYLEETFRSEPELLSDVTSMLEARSNAATPLIERALSRSSPSTHHIDRGAQTHPLGPGARIGPYEIEQFIGRGGMGHVYRARHLALGRRAALKLLAPGVSERASSLAREADLASRIQHPGVATFYELLDLEDHLAIAMEYVEGRTLREHLSAGAIPLSRAVRIVSGVLDALAHAHSVGVIHRDIKPENIVVTGESSAKLLDFGVALFLNRDEAGRRSAEDAEDAENAIVGTLAYMSPEQLGGAPIDARSDVFAVGAVFYEMLAGRSAFAGRTEGEIWNAVFRCSPEPLTDAQCPAALRDVIAKALCANVEERFASARDFLTALKGVTHQHSRSVTNTLAVLDFQNLGHEAHAWLGVAIVDGLSTGLRRVQTIELVPGERVGLAKQQASSQWGSATQQLGLALGCRWVISGSFSVNPTHVHVTVQLSDVVTSELLLHRRFEHEVSALSDLQPDLVDACATVLGATAAPPTQRANALAIEMYSRGRSLRMSLAKGKLHEAREFYERAIAADPTYAPALAELGAVHSLQFIFTTDPSDLERGLGYCERAIHVEPTNAQAHVWRGYALSRLDRLEEGLAAERRAMELDASDFYGPYFGSVIALQRGLRDAALELSQRAVANGPFASTCWLQLGWTQLCLNLIVESRYSLGRALAVEGGRNSMPGTAAYLGECLRRAGLHTSARAHCLIGLDAIEKSDHVYRDTLRSFALCTLGRTALEQADSDTARAAFSQVLSQLNGRQRAVGAGHLYVQALAGLTRVGEGPEFFEQASELFGARERFNFQYFHGCHSDVTLLELAHAARALDRRAEADALLTRARQAGSLEPVHWQESS